MAKVKLTLIKSLIDRPKRQKATVNGLGLHKVNHSVEKELNDSVQGMISKVKHLLKIEEV